MNAAAIIELSAKLLLVCLWLSWKALLFVARGAALATTAVIPPTSSRGAAASRALLAAGAWTVMVGVMAAVSRDPTVTAAGFGLGAVIGLLVAWAVLQRGWAQAAVQAGAVTLGESIGMLGVRQPHLVPRASRVRHLAVFGPTGSGKSTVLKNLVCQDAAAPGRPGLLCIDIKDDLVTEIAAQLPPDRVGDVLLFDPADTAFPPAFNPLADVPPEGRTLAAEHATRSSLLRSVNPARCPGGFAIPPSLVTSLVTNPVYLGWWLVDGQVVKTENHPALVDVDVFLRAQEALSRHGRGPGRQAGRGSVKPQLLSGLVRCGRHEVPAPMLAISTRFGRYHCEAGYRRAQLDHHCTLLDARVLDEPVADVVLNRCGFAEYADAVLTEMESEYDAAREEARRRQRELARLEREVATLRENLALTRTPDQVQTLFDLIESRTARIKELADARNSRVGRMLTAAQVATVRSFLADLRTGWSKQPLALKNELLRLLLDRVDVNADRDRIIATVVWHSGDQQTLHVARPPLMRDKAAWTSEDDTWLRERYADAPLGELRVRFPNRTATAIRNRAKLLGVRRARQTLPGGDGVPWDAAEDAIVRAYAAGEIDHSTMLNRLPRRSWDGIRGRMQKLRVRNPGSRVLYHVVAEERGMLSLAGHSWRASRRRRSGRQIPPAGRMAAFAAC